jgi:hypothetical protein
MTSHVLFLAAFNLSEWIGPAFVAFFFFVVPIVRAMRESKEKQKQLAQKREQASVSGGGAAPEKGAPADWDAEQARRKWEALLRGEEIEPGPYTPAAKPEVVRAPPPVEASEPATLVGSLSSLEPAPSEDEQESSFDEERMSQIDNETLAREEKKRRDDFLFAEREGAPVRADVAPALPPERPSEPVLVAADARRRESLFGPGARPGSRSALRRAILASEVLGRPVGLRDGSDEAGPIAARR